MSEMTKRTKYIANALKKRLTYQEIADSLGISRQRVHQIVVKELGKDYRKRVRQRV